MKRKPKKARAARGEGPSKGLVHGPDGMVWVDIPPGALKQVEAGTKPDVSMSSLSMGCSVPYTPCPLCPPGKCSHR